MEVGRVAVGSAAASEVAASEVAGSAAKEEDSVDLAATGCLVAEAVVKAEAADLAEVAVVMEESTC